MSPMNKNKIKIKKQNNQTSKNNIINPTKINFQQTKIHKFKIKKMNNSTVKKSKAISYLILKMKIITKIYLLILIQQIMKLKKDGF